MDGSPRASRTGRKRDGEREGAFSQADIWDLGLARFRGGPSGEGGGGEGQNVRRDRERERAREREREREREERERREREREEREREEREREREKREREREKERETEGVDRIYRVNVDSVDLIVRVYRVLRLGCWVGVFQGV